MIQIDMEIPDCCGNCPCFHFENPMYCRARTDVHQRVVAPYHGPRPNWCPLQETPTVNTGCNTDLISRKAAIDRLNATPPGNWSKARYTRELWNVPSVEAIPVEDVCELLMDNADCPPNHIPVQDGCTINDCKECWKNVLMGWMEAERNASD